ncbi:MAG: TIGR03936 family radical SAM-associated protein [Candidatus Omnitrophota bacterium]
MSRVPGIRSKVVNDIRRAFRVVFAKKGPMKYISHLDLQRLFQRAARRADLPLVMSQGFSPRPKMSFKRALKLGLESEAEEMSLQVHTGILPEDFINRLQAQLPEGIFLKNIEEIN